MPTQEERRAATTAKLVSAGAAVLVGDGTAGFSTVAVAREAGMSNGALFRNFPTRVDLLVASVQHLLGHFRHIFADQFTRLSPDPTMDDILRTLWSCVDRPELLAIADVGAQTRTDPELAQRLAPVMQDHHDQIGELIRLAKPADLSDEVAEHVGFLFIYAMAGLSADNAMGVGLGRQETFLSLGVQLLELLTTGTSTNKEPSSKESPSKESS